jgi:3-hydroxyisobutyrate dehydrogenase-like beta-hydroxyacid dehydrogenase
MMGGGDPAKLSTGQDQAGAGMSRGKRIGFVGLGNMGSAMAPRLATAGYEVVAFDPADAGRAALVQAGGRFANSLIELGRQSDIVLLSLPTPQVVREVVLGESGLIHQRPRLVIDLSTSGPQVSAEIGRALDMAGIGFVDAPVSGGRAGALAGRLSLMVACARTIWAQVEALLAVFGRVFYVGTQAGQGQMMKLVNNLLSAAALAITSEGVALGVKAGLDPHTMIGVLNASSGANSATADKFPRAVLPRTFDFGFQTGLALKDLRLCLDEAEALNVPMMLGNVVSELLAIVQARFGTESDFTRTAQMIEEWAGVEIR